MTPTARIVESLARDAGFDLIGFGPAEPGADGRRFSEWIEAGRHGEMHYLARNHDRILDPTRLLPGARSSIALGFEYGRDEIVLEGGGRVARYAAGRDYHRALGRRLETLCEGLSRAGLPRSALRAGVDAVPILERALALRAGIGFLAKSSGIIHPDRGPWLLLAEILSTAALEPSAPAPGSCGTCTACLEACPTQAIVAPFEVDARACLSYTTIELRGAIPRELRAPQGDWLFGCDVCIEVCPFTSKSAPRRNDPDLAPHAAVTSYDLVGILQLSQEQFDRDWTGTAMRRARRRGLQRNAAIVLGNLGDDRAVPALRGALGDRAAEVRVSAAWALAQLGDRPALCAAIDREQDTGARRDMQRSLEEIR